MNETANPRPAAVDPDRASLADLASSGAVLSQAAARVMAASGVQPDTGKVAGGFQSSL